jgi:hypothetical protein
MKIYSNKITSEDVRSAFSRARNVNGADIWIDDLRTFRPRRRHGNGIEVFATSDGGSRATGHAPIGSYDRSDLPRAASWTDYGYVMSYLFNEDPGAIIAQYNGKADFVATCRKYPRKDQGNSLAFLDVLEPPICPACGSVEADCEPGCVAVS